MKLEIPEVLRNYGAYSKATFSWAWRRWWRIKRGVLIAAVVTFFFGVIGVLIHSWLVNRWPQLRERLGEPINQLWSLGVALGATAVVGVVIFLALLSVAPSRIYWSQQRRTRRHLDSLKRLRQAVRNVAPATSATGQERAFRTRCVAELKDKIYGYKNTGTTLTDQQAAAAWRYGTHKFLEKSLVGSHSADFHDATKPISNPDDWKTGVAGGIACLDGMPPRLSETDVRWPVDAGPGQSLQILFDEAYDQTDQNSEKGQNIPYVLRRVAVRNAGPTRLDNVSVELVAIDPLPASLAGRLPLPLLFKHHITDGVRAITLGPFDEQQVDVLQYYVKKKPSITEWLQVMHSVVHRVGRDIEPRHYKIGLQAKSSDCPPTPIMRFDVRIRDQQVSMHPIS